MPRRRCPEPGPCVHCLTHTDEPTWDHVFPKAWYPDTTPRNMEKWKIPSCPECNRAYGRLEEELLVRLGMGLDPNNARASGIPDKVLRSLDPRAARDEKDAAQRAARRDRILREAIAAGTSLIPHTLPGFRPAPGSVYPAPALLVRATDLHRLVEKLIRGLTYVQEVGMLIGPDYSFTFFFDPGQGAVIQELLDRFGRAQDRGPGLIVDRAAPAEDRRASVFSVEIWGSLCVWGTVEPVAAHRA